MRRYDGSPGEYHSWYCNDCGENHTGTKQPFYMHECNPENIILHQREQFDAQLATFLGSPEGKFAQHMARQEVDGDEHSVA